MTKAKINKEGLTFLEWTRAAGYDENTERTSIGKTDQRKAWEEGEDPTDHRAALTNPPPLGPLGKLANAVIEGIEIQEASNPLGRYFCRCCASKGLGENVPAEERYSMQVYAGMYCDPCWAVDGRNHDRPFDPMDAGEAYSEDDY